MSQCMGLEGLVIQTVDSTGESVVSNLLAILHLSYLVGQRDLPTLRGLALVPHSVSVK